MNKQLTSADMTEPEKLAEGTGRDYWDDSGQLFFTGNHVWGVAPDLSNVCLGGEFEVLTYLKDGTLPKSVSETAIEILENIRQCKIEGGLHGQADRIIPTAKRCYESGIRQVSGKRSRLMLDHGRRPAGVRRAAGSKRLSNRLPQPQYQGVSGS